MTHAHQKGLAVEARNSQQRSSGNNASSKGTVEMGDVTADMVASEERLSAETVIASNTSAHAFEAKSLRLKTSQTHRLIDAFAPRHFCSSVRSNRIKIAHSSLAWPNVTESCWRAWGNTQRRRGRTEEHRILPLPDPFSQCYVPRSVAWLSNGQLLLTRGIVHVISS